MGLYDFIATEGSPTSFVMGYFNPSGGLTTLYDYIKSHPQIITAIPNYLLSIFKIMRRHYIFHGDMCPCHVLGQEVSRNDAAKLGFKFIGF